jgi:4a-hydroxytetrahydrobiopterin dehydratase
MEVTEKKNTSYQQESPLLSQDKIREMSGLIPQWSLGDREIKREIVFNDFREAFDFVKKVAAVSEEHAHHPDIRIFYNKVQLTLSTHKAGGLTDRDFELASEIERIISSGMVTKEIPL